MIIRPKASRNERKRTERGAGSSKVEEKVTGFLAQVDEGGEDGCGGGGAALPGDGLPLVVFEMAGRRPAEAVAAEAVDGDRTSGSTRLLAGFPDSDASADADVAYACSRRTGACRYRVRGDEWECAAANKHACMCKRRVDGEFRYVGATAGLKGNRPRLYHNNMRG